MKVLRDFAQLFIVLLQWSKSIRHSRLVILLVILTGVVAGLSSTALIAIINTVLSGQAASHAGLLFGFIGLCALIPISGFASQSLLVRLTTQAGYHLRMRLCRQILSAPLRVVEELGPHRLFAMLSDDIPTVTAAISTLPLLFTQLAIVAGC